MRRIESLPACIPVCAVHNLDDGRPSKYFYWDDQSSQRLRSEQLGRGEALKQAQAFAREMRDQATHEQPASLGPPLTNY